MSENVCRVLVVGPNPAMDIVLETETFTPGQSQRARRALHLAGGKPLNVARTLRRLGVEVNLASPLGGQLGPRGLIAESCRELGITLHACTICGETRTCVILVDSETGESSVVNELGPQLFKDEATAYEELVASVLRPDGLVLASGSLPPGLCADFYAEIVKRAGAVGALVIVDSSGEPLRRALDAGPWAVKINGAELLAVTASSSINEAAHRLAGRIEHVVVTLGIEGALYVGTAGTVHVPAVPVPSKNATGAGDAFLAGLAAGLVNSDGWPQALCLATAASALACTQLGPDIGPEPRIGEMMQCMEKRSMRAAPNACAVPAGDGSATGEAYCRGSKEP